MHESHAGRDKFFGAGVVLRADTVFDEVVSVTVEALALDVFLRPVDCEVDSDDGYQCFALVLGDGLPGDEVDLLEGVGQPVVIAEEVEVVVLLSDEF